MKKLNLQLFAEAVKGKDIIYLYRLAKESKAESGTILAFTTENSKSISKDADSTATKDGSIRTPGQAEISVSFNSIMTVGDPMIKKLQDACRDGELMEIWEVNLTDKVENKENKFKGTYYQGYLSSFELGSSAEGFTEISGEFGINGDGADGEVSVSREQQETAAYVFKDAVPENGNGSIGA